jgi:RNA polymerase sigma factor (sigma-70 family)
MNEALAQPCFAPVWPVDSLPTRSSLVKRLSNLGDDASWRAFFDTYWLLIYNVARKSGLSDADAQDIVQDTVICVARKMPQFRYDPAKGSFKQWLLVITRRRIQDHLRRLYRGLPAAMDALDARAQQVPCPALPPDAQIDAAWEAQWRATFFQTALARLRQRSNPKHYQVFDYCVLQQLRPGEVARMLGLTAAQVYLAKHRFNRALRRELAQLDRELGQAATT